MTVLALFRGTRAQLTCPKHVSSDQMWRQNLWLLTPISVFSSHTNPPTGQLPSTLFIEANLLLSLSLFPINGSNLSIVKLRVQFSHSVVSYFLWPHGLQHAKLLCPSPTAKACSNLCPSSQWCHPTILSSVAPFFCLQSFPASGAFQISQFFTSGGQTIGISASASVLPMNIQGWFPLGWTGWTTLQSKGFSRVFSNTTVQKHQFFSTQLSLWSNSHIHTWLLEKP